MHSHFKKSPESVAWSRRAVLKGVAATGGFWAAPWLRAQTGSEGRLILVFLRGAYDGLSALVPHGDVEYRRLRPTIAIAAPDAGQSSAQPSALPLDGMFGLHPALAPLHPLWTQGVLAALPCAGSTDTTRSHFDAQLHWETGTPGKSSGNMGWLNKLAGLDSPHVVGAVGVGEANPLILSGPAKVQLVPRGRAATQTGVLANSGSRDALMKLYGGDDSIGQAFRSGAQSRMQTSQTLSAETMAADNGAGSAQGLTLDARHLGTLMRQDKRLRIGFLSSGGWDTHAAQGNVTGALANNLGQLANALVQLRRDFSQPDDVVVVCSEFGRTCAENGTRGTDHGHGNTLWLMGNRVQGGKVHGEWSGLSKGNLNEGRDLPVHHDFRGVFAQVLKATQGLDNQRLDQLFPGFEWDNALNQLMHL